MSGGQAPGSSDERGGIGRGKSGAGRTRVPLELAGEVARHGRGWPDHGDRERARGAAFQAAPRWAAKRQIFRVAALRTEPGSAGRGTPEKLRN